MKVENMTSSKGNKIANQFIITDMGGEKSIVCFQSYNSVIVERKFVKGTETISLDRNTWDFGVTTGKYRNQFLGETKKETQAKIDSGEYILADLN